MAITLEDLQAQYPDKDPEILRAALDMQNEEASMPKGLDFSREAGLRKVIGDTGDNEVDPVSFARQWAGTTVSKAAEQDIDPIAFAKQWADSPAPAKEDTTGNFARGAKTALGQTIPLAKGMIGAVGATAEKVFGEGGVSTAIKDWGINGYIEGMEKLQPLSRENDDVTTAYRKAQEGDIGALVDWAGYGLGYGVGQLGETAIVALVGGLAGAGAGPGGIASGVAGGVFAKTGVKTIASGIVQKLVSKEALRITGGSAVKAAEEAVVKQATKNVARAIGASVALTGYNEMMEVGSIYPEAEAEAKRAGREMSGSDLAKVWGWGTAAAMTESAADMLGLGAVTGKIRIPGAGGRVARGLTGAATGGAIEGAQEGVQTWMEWKGAQKDTGTSEFNRDLVNSMAMGALPGAGVGGLSGAIHIPKAAAPPPPKEQEILSAPDTDTAIQKAMESIAVPDTEAEFASLLKDEGIDLSYRRKSAIETAQKEADMSRMQVSALAQEADANALLSEVTEAPTAPTALQLAMETAKQKRIDDERQRLLRGQSAEVDAKGNQGVGLVGVGGEGNLQDQPVVGRGIRNATGLAGGSSGTNLAMGAANTRTPAVTKQERIAMEAERLRKIRQGKQIGTQTAEAIEKQTQRTQEVPATAVAGEQDAQSSPMLPVRVEPATNEPAMVEGARPVPAESPGVAAPVPDATAATSIERTTTGKLNLKGFTPEAIKEATAELKTKGRDKMGRGTTVPLRLDLRQDPQGNVLASVVNEAGQVRPVSKLEEKAIREALAGQTAAEVRSESERVEPEITREQIDSEAVLSQKIEKSNTSEERISKSAKSEQNQEKQPAAPVAESLALEPSEPSDAGVAPGQGGAAANTKTLAEASLGDLLRAAADKADGVMKQAEGAPTPNSGELGSRALSNQNAGAASVRDEKSGALAEPTQFGSGAGSKDNIASIRRAVQAYREAQPLDRYEYDRRLKEVQEEVERDWSNGSADDYSGRFGPDQIHTQLKRENAAAYYDADGDLTEAGHSRYPEIEHELSAQIARDELGEPQRKAVDLSRPGDMAKFLHGYLDERGFEPNAIGGSGKSASQYLEVDVGGKRVGLRIADHKLPPEYDSKEMELALYDVATDDVRPDGREGSIGIDEDEATRRTAALVSELDRMRADQGKETPATLPSGEANEQSRLAEIAFDDSKITTPDRGLKIGARQKIYRGTSDRTGRNTANIGRGLYTTTDKDEAKLYGNVSEMPVSDLPQNPLRFQDEGKFREWESYVIRKAFGYSRLSEFTETPDVWVRKIDPSIDGIQIGVGDGAFFVKFPGETAKEREAAVTDKESLTVAPTANIEEQDKGIALFSRATPQAISEETTGDEPIQASAEDRAAVDALNAQFEKQEGISNAYDLSPLRSERLAAALKSAFGVDVISIRPVAEGAGGFYGMLHDGKIFINTEQRDVGFVQVAGHELLHQLKRDRPGLYAYFADQARNAFAPGAVERYRERLTAVGDTKSDAEEELLADFTGDAITDPEFLQRMADGNQSKFRMFVSYVMNWLKNVADKLSRNGFGSSEYFADVNSAREYLAAALQAYSDTKVVPKQTETPAFKAWFGNSKVVDAEGKPLVVYHGTETKGIEIFDRSKAGKSGPSKFGFWFTDQQSFAEFFGGEQMPVYLSIQNPKRISQDRWNSIRDDHAKDGAWFDLWRDSLKAQGLDGLIVEGRTVKVGKFDVAEPAVMAVFDPTQIKSAVGNKGTFDPKNANILFSQAPIIGDSGRKETKPSDADQSAVDALNAQFEKQEGVANAFAPSVLQEGRLADAFKRAFGVDIVGIRPLSRGVVGFLGMQHGGKLFVNTEQRDVGFVQVAGHELLHQIKKDSPSIYNWFAERAADYTKAGAAERYRSNAERLGYKAEQDDLNQEMLADFVGDSLSDPNFLQALADNNPTKFRLFLNEVITWLKNVAGKLAGNGFGSSQYFTDVRELQGYLVGVLDAYSKTKAVPPMSNEVDNTASRSSVESPLGDSEAIDEAQRVFLSSFPADVRTYRRSSGTAKAAREISDRAFDAINATPEAPRKVDGVRMGPFSGFETDGSIERGLDGKDHLVVNLWGKEQIEEGLMDVPALRMTVEDDGDFSIYGPPSKSKTFKEFQKLGWAELATNPDGEVHTIDGESHWTRLIGSNDRQALELLGDAHARLRAWTGKGHVGMHWVRTTGATGGEAGKRGAIFFARARIIDDNNRQRTPEQADGWKAADMTKLDDLIYTLQDKQVDTRRTVEAIRKVSGDIEDKWNPYLQEELFHGRAAKGVKDFLDLELKPLLVEMKARGIELSDFEEYLWNRHAEERNKQIAKINPDMPDGGSGLNTSDARQYLSGLPEAKRESYEALAARTDAINAKTRQGLVDSGLETADTISAWEVAYKHYVPLQREDVDTGGIGTGKGYSVRGSSTKRAMGSGKPVADILANIAQQRERAIVRAEKNRVSNALMGLAIKSPNPEFWTVDEAPTERVVENKAIYKVVDNSTGVVLDEFTSMQDADKYSIRHNGTSVEQTWEDRVTERIVPGFITRDNVVSTRIDGKDHYIVFNEADLRAMRMASALKNIDADQLGRVLSITSKMTRYFASINTQYNPIFGIINLFRDSQGALLNLSTTPISGEQKKVLGYTIDALRGIYADLRAHRKGQVPSSNWAQLWEEFQKEGGQTGYRDQYANAVDRTEALEKELRRAGEGKAKGFGRAVFEWLSDYNETMENAVRLAAYRASKESGMSSQKAASLAKNLTVNFNRKGQVATQAGALYAFFNASVQGTARMAETLAGPMGKKIIAGGVLLGAMQAALFAIAGFDDDEPPEFVRERALILPLPNGKYLSIPMPLGFHVIPNLGRIPAEFVLGGFKNPGKRITDLLGLFTDTFNPIGNAGLSLQTIAPTVIDPLAALAENRDWTGKPIAKENMNPLAPKPGHLLAKDTASEVSKAASYWINLATGGTKYKPGLVSPTPDQLDYLIGQATGGVGREYLKAEQTVSSAASGEEMPLYKVPLVGRFIGDTTGQAAESGRFYENLKRINEHEAEIKGLRKEGDALAVTEYRLDNPESRLVAMANAIEREISKLRSQKREALELGKSEMVKILDQAITAKMKRLNDAVRRLEEKQAA